MPLRAVNGGGSTSASSSSTSSSAENTAATSPETPRTFTDGLPLPKLLIFDLDYTLWPFWVDTHVDPPFRAVGSSGGSTVKDAHGYTMSFYKEVPSVLRAAREKGLLIGAASRTYTPELARELLGMLYVPLSPSPPSSSSSSAKATSGSGSASDKQQQKKEKAAAFFDAMQIFPGNKVSHMTKLGKQLGVAYEDMLFFDDEQRNANVERELGVCFWLVRNGVTRAEIDRGVEKWRKQRGVGGESSAAAKKKAAKEKRGVDISLVDDDDDED